MSRLQEISSPDLETLRSCLAALQVALLADDPNGSLSQESRHECMKLATAALRASGVRPPLRRVRK